MATNPGHATLCGRQPAGRAGSVGSPQRYGPGSRGAAPPPTPAPRPGCAACTGTGLGTKASNPPARQSLIPNPAVDGMPADPNLPPERVGVLTGGQLAHHLSPLLGGMRCIGGLPDQLIPKQSDRPRPLRAHLALSSPTATGRSFPFAVCQNTRQRTGLRPDRRLRQGRLVLHPLAGPARRQQPPT